MKEVFNALMLITRRSEGATGGMHAEGVLNEFRSGVFPTFVSRQRNV